MIKKVIGHFYLKKTVNRNLLGEFTNETTENIFTESADLQSPIGDDSFSGIYLTTWRENRDSYIYELRVSINEKSNNLKYNLLWKNIKDSNVIFIGEGFLVNNMLIGHYRTF